MQATIQISIILVLLTLPLQVRAQSDFLVKTNSRDGVVNYVSMESDADQSKLTLVKSNPATYDIGGVKLGMSPGDIINIAKLHGLEIYDLSKADATFDQEVVTMMKSLRGEYAESQHGQVAFLRLKDSQGSVWEIQFSPTRAGPAVTLIDYYLPLNGRSFKTFSQSLVEKYGAPNAGTFGDSMLRVQWCGGGQRDCTFVYGARLGKEPAILTGSSDFRSLHLQLSEGSKAAIERQNAITAQAKANLAKTAPKATF